MAGSYSPVEVKNTVNVAVTSGTIDIGTVAATISVALDGTGAGDTAGIVDAAGDRLAINADGSINVALTGATTGLTDAELRATPVPVSGTVAVTSATLATSAKQDLLLTELQLKADLTETQPVSIAGTVATSNSALLTELQLKADLTETQPVSLASVPTHAVTQSGTWNIGSVTTLPAVVLSQTGTDNNVDANITNASIAVTAAALPLPSNAAQETGGNLASLVAKDFATSAKQDTGNASLATISAKDFATQTTLALIKAKTDNLDVTLSGGGAHVIIDSMPAVESSTTALVSDSIDSLIPGDTSPLLMTTEGRLRVSVANAVTYIELYNIQPEDFGVGDPRAQIQSNNPWS